jgi:uncharacterized protein YdeI (YjbR/CyaY-like superfamily)
VNIKKVENLTANGLMQPAGLAIYALRTEAKSKVYSFENPEVALAPEMEAQFRANESAWQYYQALAPGYRKASSAWVMGAKQATTQHKRLEILIADSAAGINQWKENKYKK